MRGKNLILLFIAAVCVLFFIRWFSCKYSILKLGETTAFQNLYAPTAGELVLEPTLWSMLCVDDAGVVSKLSEQLRKMMEAIVVVCAAFGLAVSEAMTETMCLHTKEMPESTAIFRVEAAGQVYSQTKEFAYLERNVNHNNADLSTEVDRCIRNACCSFRKYTPELYDRSRAPLELKIRMLRAEVLETMNAVRLAASRGARARAFTTRCGVYARMEDTRDNECCTISYLDTLIKTGSESIETTLRRRRILLRDLCAHGGYENETAEVR